MGIAIAISAVGFASLWAGPLPAQSDSVAQEGAMLAQTRCVICHSADLVTQQRLSRAQWNATVTKMVHWGAPLSASEQKVLVEYLSSRYPPDASEEKSE
jgi:mono/diheme cytochrome c family protein